MGVGLPSIALVLGLLGGCGSPEREAPSDEGEQARVEAREAPRYPAASEEEALAVASRFATALEAGDQEGWSEVFAPRAMFELALGERAVDAEFRDGLLQGAPSTAATMFQNNRRSMEGAALRPLGVRTEEGATWAALGVIFPSGEFNQLHLQVAKVQGTPKWVDLWTLVDGRSTSEMVGRSLDQVLLANGSLDEGAARRASAMQALVQPLQAGDYVAVLQAYDQASPEVKALREAHGYRIAAASHADLANESYGRILEEFLEAFPDDPGARVQRIDLLAMQGKHAEAGEAFAALHADHPDAYLLTLAAGSFHKAGELERARETIEAAVAHEPGLMEAWSQRLLIAVAQGDSPAVSETLERLGSEHGVTPAVFGEDASWERLRGMPAYASWAATFDSSGG